MNRGVPKKRVINSHLAEVGYSGVLQLEVQPVVAGSVVRITFESVDSPWRQAV